MSNRICFVSPFAFPLLCGQGSGAGGAERQFFLFGRGLTRLGWDVRFITHTPPAALAGLPTEFPVYPVHFGYLGGSKTQMPLALLGLWRAMRRVDADYYVLKTPIHLLPLMVLYGRYCYRRAVFWGQTTYVSCGRQAKQNGWPQKLESWGIKNADLVIAQTRKQQMDFQRDYSVGSIIVRSFAEPLIVDQKAERTLPNEDRIDVLWAGNQLTNKRMDVVLELARQAPEYRFALATKITDSVQYAKTLTDAQSIPNMLMLGEVPHVEMENWFRRTRVLLNTSEREGFPNTFLQAWMNGIPVVSLCVDPDHLIEKKMLGKVVSPSYSAESAGDPSVLAASIVDVLRELLKNEQLRLKMGENGKSYIKENHASERVVLALIDALRGAPPKSS